MSSSPPAEGVKGRWSPSTWSLRARLLIGQVLLLTLACIGIGAVTELALHQYLDEPARRPAARRGPPFVDDVRQPAAATAATARGRSAAARPGTRLPRRSRTTRRDRRRRPRVQRPASTPACSPPDGQRAALTQRRRDAGGEIDAVSRRGHRRPRRPGQLPADGHLQPARRGHRHRAAACRASTTPCCACC